MHTYLKRAVHATMSCTVLNCIVSDCIVLFEYLYSDILLFQWPSLIDPAALSVIVFLKVFVLISFGNIIFIEYM